MNSIFQFIIKIIVPPAKVSVILLTILVILSACAVSPPPELPLLQKSFQLDGLTIHYTESQGKGQSVVFVHGNSSSSSTFQKQFQGWLGQKYHLVAFDLPGHGQSDRVTQLSDYSLPGYAKKLEQLVKNLQLEDAVFVGWSLGGHIVLEAVDSLPDASGFVIFGTPPLAVPPNLAAAFLPALSSGAGFKASITEAEATQFANDFFAPDSKVDTQPFIAEILATDGNARAGLAASLSPDYPYRKAMDEVEVVARMSKPLAIFHGTEEQLINPVYFDNLAMPTLWRGQVQLIPGSGHTPQWEQPEVFNSLLDNFISDVSDN
ncbi:MAG: alpha/beta hydrolase [Gammaproteobacteria bacterium]|nr:alpha/beta hydrolase [Gammaproteobacteria bacterium]